MRMQVSFPTRLYNLLEAADKTIVDWLPNEKAFCVNDMERFVNVILPQYFNHSKFGSFQRQLNTYGFKRILRGYHLGAYFHPDFQKGRVDLLSKIKRMIPSKSGDGSCPNSPTRRRRKSIDGSVAGGSVMSNTNTPAGSPIKYDTQFHGDNFFNQPPATNDFTLFNDFDGGLLGDDGASSRTSLPSSRGGYPMPQQAMAPPQNQLPTLPKRTLHIPPAITQKVKIEFQDGMVNGMTEITIDPAVLSQYGEIYYLPVQGGRPIRILAIDPASRGVPAPPQPPMSQLHSGGNYGHDLHGCNGTVCSEPSDITQEQMLVQ